jgi:hypothetical protein
MQAVLGGGGVYVYVYEDCGGGGGGKPFSGWNEGGGGEGGRGLGRRRLVGIAHVQDKARAPVFRL